MLRTLLHGHYGRQPNNCMRWQLDSRGRTQRPWRALNGRGLISPMVKEKQVEEAIYDFATHRLAKVQETEEIHRMDEGKCDQLRTRLLRLFLFLLPS